MRVLLITLLLASCSRYAPVETISSNTESIDLKIENDSLRKEIKRRDTHLMIMVDRLIMSDIQIDSVLHLSIVEIGKIMNNESK